MTLEEAIADAQSFQSDPPTNESNTCDWIILPLLHASGYSGREIDSRIADNGGQFPDYTLLPNNHSRCWYLEAKARSVALEDVHARQALNYANHNGRRFVVLTNGQQWRLYDNQIQGKLPEKLIAQAALQETAKVAEFLTFLSKAQVLADSFENVATETRDRKHIAALEEQERQEREAEAKRAYQRQRELYGRLQAELPSALSDANSEIVQFIALYLEDKGTYKDLTPVTLSGWFNELFSQPPTGQADEISSTDVVQKIRPAPANSYNQRTLNLNMMHGLPIDGKSTKPISLRTPDGVDIVVTHWVDLAEESVRWLMLQSSKLPVPFHSGNRNRWFLNHTNVHRNSRESDKFRAISTNGTTVYMDGDRSAKDLLEALFDLCQAVQIRPEKFQFTVIG